MAFTSYRIWGSLALALLGTGCVSNQKSADLQDTRFVDGIAAFKYLQFNPAASASDPAMGMAPTEVPLPPHNISAVDPATGATLATATDFGGGGNFSLGPLPNAPVWLKFGKGEGSDYFYNVPGQDQITLRYLTEGRQNVNTATLQTLVTLSIGDLFPWDPLLNDLYYYDYNTQTFLMLADGSYPTPIQYFGTYPTEQQAATQALSTYFCPLSLNLGDSSASGYMDWSWTDVFNDYFYTFSGALPQPGLDQPFIIQRAFNFSSTGLLYKTSISGAAVVPSQLDNGFGGVIMTELAPLPGTTYPVTVGLSKFNPYASATGDPSQLLAAVLVSYLPGGGYVDTFSFIGMPAMYATYPQGAGTSLTFPDLDFGQVALPSPPDNYLRVSVIAIGWPDGSQMEFGAADPDLTAMAAPVIPIGPVRSISFDGAAVQSGSPATLASQVGWDTQASGTASWYDTRIQDLLGNMVAEIYTDQPGFTLPPAILTSGAQYLMTITSNYQAGSTLVAPFSTSLTASPFVYATSAPILFTKK